MFPIFHLDVACVSSGCCKSRSRVAYVAMAINVCCKCMFQIFQLFQTYVASVLSRYYICCGSYTHMLQAYVPNVLPVQIYVASVLSGCLRILQWLQTYVASVCFKCFTLF
jgi:hypothetical protein